MVWFASQVVVEDWKPRDDDAASAEVDGDRNIEAHAKNINATAQSSQSV